MLLVPNCSELVFRSPVSGAEIDMLDKDDLCQRRTPYFTAKCRYL